VTTGTTLTLLKSKPHNIRHVKALKTTGLNIT